MLPPPSLPPRPAALRGPRALVLRGALRLAAGALGAVALTGCGGDAEAETIYWCSMHPEVRQPEPGTCALCGGMRLVPLDQSLADEAGVLRLDDVQVQQAGVRVRAVERRELFRPLDLTGRFRVDPDREEVVYNPLPGSSRVAAVHYSTAGATVERGAALVEVENELLSQQVVQLRDALDRHAELLAQEGRERQAEEMLRRLETIRQELEDSGVPRAVAERLAREGDPRERTLRFPVVAEHGGTLMRTPLLEVGRFTRQGEALFRLADTKSLWLELDVHAADLAWLEPGQHLRYESPSVPGEVFRTTLDAVEPVADSGAVEVRVRARADSAGGRILPGTWARVRVEAEAGTVLAVPASAVLRTGARDVALVAEGMGRFRPVALTLGRRDLTERAPADAPDATARALAPVRYHAVRDGLAAGDRVVTAGSFLLLSEANFQGALEKLVGEDPGVRETPAALAAVVPAVLERYEELRVALAADAGADLREPAAALAATLDGLDRAGFDARAAGLAERLVGSARALADAADGEAVEDPELLVLRRRFGALSREVVALVRDHARERVESGALHLFSCPMAEEFGFDRWLQRPAEMANPYMGQRMLACGTAAEL